MSTRATVYWNGTDLKLHSRINGTIPIPPVASQYPTAVLRNVVQTPLNLTVSGALSTVSSQVAPKPTILTYGFDWGDGQLSFGTSAQASHTYAKAGTYTVGLTVTDSNSLSSTTSLSVVIAPVPVLVGPTGTLGPATSSGLTGTFPFTATAQDAGATIFSVNITYSDGGANGTSSSSGSFSHLFGAPGTYSATIKITDSNGRTATNTASVTVAAPNVAPSAKFVWTPNGPTVTFDASGSSDSDGSLVSYAWTFGDGTTGTGVKPSHTYTTSGNFTVGLTVTDNQGATDFANAAVPVTVPTGPVQPSGPGIVQYQSLSGSTLGDKLRSTTSQVSFPSGVFDMVDFADGSGTSGADNNTVAGVLGSGSKFTTFQLRANTSTKTAPTSGTNNMQTLQFRNRTNLKLQGFTVAYTSQRDIANGLAVRGTNGLTMSDIKLVGFKGNSQSPPGETFYLNLNSVSGGTTLSSIEADGQGVASSLLATNTFSGGLTANDLVLHDTYSSSHKATNGACKGFAFWQHSGGATFNRLKSYNNWATIGFERCSGTFIFNDPILDGSDKLFGHLGNDGYSTPCKIIINVSDVSKIPAGGFKFWIPVNYNGKTNSNTQKLSDVTVNVAGVATPGYASSVAYPQ